MHKYSTRVLFIFSFSIDNLQFFLLYPVPSTQLSFVIPLLLPYKSMAKACERHITNYCFTCHFYLPEISNRVEIRFQTIMINSYPRDKRITNYRAQDSFPRRTWCTSAKMGSIDHHEGRPESQFALEHSQFLDSPLFPFHPGTHSLPLQKLALTARYKFVLCFPSK